MDFFVSARNFFDNAPLPQQVTWSFGLLLVSLVAIMAGAVLIRRSFGTPIRKESHKKFPDNTVLERYELMARFWHWSLLGMILALLISGLAFYAPGLLPGPAPIIGISWLWVHLFFAALFVLGIVSHSLHGLLAGSGAGVVWFNGRDWQEFRAKIKYYFAMGREVPKTGKFSVSNKVFHWTLAVLAFLMAATGISLTLDTLGLAAIDQNWQRQQRILHDIGSWGFITILVAHIFWQLLRGNLRTMFTGTITPEKYREEYDWDQWQPEEHNATQELPHDAAADARVQP